MHITHLLIGQDNLLIQCGNLLLNNSHQIKWVISSNQAIKIWCQQNDITCLSSFEDLPLGEDHKVDYLFSIVNGRILKREHIQLARLGAINYHDSLLPKYAGVNATTWALINGEKEHGITWHFIDEGIDEGDIIYQHKFAINKTDTALTLNLRCFEEAIVGFSKIIAMIENSSLNRLVQAKDARCYYGINHPLPNLGFIDWENDSSSYIDRLCRALNFGNYPNNIGTLKLFLGDSYLIVTDTAVSNQSSIGYLSGSVLGIDENGILIATQDNAILIKNFTLSDGIKLSLDELIRNYNFHIGYQLPLLNHSIVNYCLPFYSKGLKSEKFWLNKLMQAIEHTTFADRLANKYSQCIEVATVKVERISETQSYDSYFYLLASVLIYLYRLNDYENFTYFLRYAELTDKLKYFGNIFSNLLPITTNIESNLSCKEILDSLSQDIEHYQKEEIYLSDIYTRHPALHNLLENYVITIGVSNGKFDIPKNSVIHFEIDQMLATLKVFHRIDCEHHGNSLTTIVASMSSHINNILQFVLNQPESKVNQFSFLTQTEIEQLIFWGIGKNIPLPSYSFKELFMQSVKFSQNKIAVFDNSETTTYSELQQEVESIKFFLQTLHLPSKAIIGIYGKANKDFLYLTLGLLQAGHTCAVLNPEVEFNMLKLQIQDKNIAHIITTPLCYKTLTENLKNLETAVQVYKFDLAHEKTFNFGGVSHTSECETSITGNNNANILFFADTENKSIILNDRKLINSCHYIAQKISLDETSVLELPSNLAPNAFLIYSFTTLLMGGTIEIQPVNCSEFNPRKHMLYIEQCNISHTFLKVKDWEKLLEYPEQISKLVGLKHILLEADVKNKDHIAYWLLLHPQSQLIVIPSPLSFA